MISFQIKGIITEIGDIIIKRNSNMISGETEQRARIMEIIRKSRNGMERKELWLNIRI